MVLEDVSNWIVAAGALGTAAFGFVEALKAKGFIGLAGMSELRAALSKPGQGVLLALLKDVYGEEEFDSLLDATYRRGPSDTSDFLRNGLRLAMAEGSQDEQKNSAVARALGQRPELMKHAYDTLAQASIRELDDATVLAQRKVIGQVELVIDARVEAAVCHADAVLAGRKRWIAGVFALLSSLFVTLLSQDCSGQSFAKAFLIGIAAVPVAPIARDLVSLLQSARDVLRGRAA
jgi:hypothetical protein